jgi:hypothetical protein
MGFAVFMLSETIAPPLYKGRKLRCHLVYVARPTLIEALLTVLVVSADQFHYKGDFL